MQYNLNIKLNTDFFDWYAADWKKAVLSQLEANKEALELMLQGYHTKEKLRQVSFITDSLKLEEAGKGNLIAEYQLEEYNICSAIDRSDMDRMTLTFIIDKITLTMKVSGIYIPEREPDSF
ncbi:hypothetical protein H9X96_11795 [Pedobacter sp. N36a]|uniref:hypothetical protein n=1 Tax=Pedobacter sp. N36a TaxID=2767996 RepID=UPI00165718E5|nr:hypothetical protein [Pedobacter sp. N36a]MBC8986461.1 hypothetical protein [Pedobacter sp. N36a]